MNLRPVIGIMCLLICLGKINAQKSFQRIYPADSNYVVSDAVQKSTSLYASIQFAVDTLPSGRTYCNNLVYSEFKPKGDVGASYKINLDPKVYGGIDMSTKAHLYIGSDGKPYISFNTFKGQNGRKQIIKMEQIITFMTSSKNIQVGQDSIAHFNIISGYEDYLVNVASTGDKTNSSIVVSRSPIEAADPSGTSTKLFNTKKSNGGQAYETVAAVAIDAKKNRIAMVGTVDSTDLRPFLLVTDTTGKVLFSRKYISLIDTIRDTIIRYFVTDLMITKDTGYVVSGYYQTKKGVQDDAIAGFIMNLDRKGNVRWGRKLKKSPDLQNDYIQSIVGVDNDEIVIAALQQENNNGASNHYAVQIDFAGNVKNQKAYIKQQASNSGFASIFKSNEGGTAWFTNTGDAKKRQMSILKLDKDLKTTCQDELNGNLLTDLRFKADTLVWTTTNGESVIASFTDTAKAIEYNVPVLILTDTIYCPDVPINYVIRLDTPIDSITQYEWNTGEKGPETDTLLVKKDGKFSLMVTINHEVCFVLCDTTEIKIHGKPQAFVGIDSSEFCATGKLQISSAMNGGFDVNVTNVWNTGEKTKNIVVDKAGTYTVEYTDGCFQKTTASAVTPFPASISKVTLTPNVDVDCLNGRFTGTIKAEGNSTTTGGSAKGKEKYKWSTGSENMTINIDQDFAGLITVTVTDECGKTATASYELVFKGENKLKLSVNGARIGCEVRLNVSTDPAGSALKYSWASGETTPFILTNKAGSYDVTVTDICNNTASKNTVLTEADLFKLNPSIYINKSCASALVSLNVSTEPEIDLISFIWSTGATTTSIETNQLGTYSVTVTDKCLNTNSVAYNLKESDISPLQLEYAKVFFPDGTGILKDEDTDTVAYKALGLNRTFGPFVPVNACPDDIENYKFYVYNRWGQQVFEADDIKEEWDGTNGDGTKHPSDTYVYVVQYTVFGIKKVQKGDVTMLR
jgi:gliding motility-associated-like protein